jgi:hypothetical protein
MSHVLTLAISFPSIVYTVLLGAVAIYWAFVMVGAAKIGLGDGDGGDVGAGDAHDVGEHGGDGGDAHDAGEHGDGGDDGGDSNGAIADLIGALRLRSVPLTIVVSGIVMFSWVFSMLGATLFTSSVMHVLTLLAAPLLALFPTSLVARPLGKLFVNPTAVTRTDLIGKTCRIRTGTVTEKFGEAELEDGGAGIVVRVRIDTDVKLARGQEAIIVGYDDEREEFTVAPMEELLPRSKH